jgi:hypothetical protein
MSDIKAIAAQIVEEIGPRPAGTEEEQHASFLIEEKMRVDAGLSTSIEEFKFNPNHDLLKNVCFFVSFLLAVLSSAISAMWIAAFILCLIAAIYVVIDALGLTFFEKLGQSGMSQNVVGKYIPAAGTQSGRARRKIVIVSHYDSGRVLPQYKQPIFAMLPVLRIAEPVCSVLIPLLMLIRLASHASGTFLVILNVLIILCGIVVLLPVIGFVISKNAPYSDGANCNAAGVAVMLDLAQRVNNAQADDEASDDVVVHGEEAADAAGVIPDGVEIVYDSTVGNAESDVQRISENEQVYDGPIADSFVEGEVEAPVEAVISGDSSKAVLSEDVSDGETVQVSEGMKDEFQAPELEIVQDVSRETFVEATSTPDWYQRARRNANQSEKAGVKPAQRSKFSDALEAANNMANAQAEMASAVQALSQTEEAAVVNLEAIRAVQQSASRKVSKKSQVDGYLKHAEEIAEAKSAGRNNQTDGTLTAQNAEVLGVSELKPTTEIAAVSETQEIPVVSEAVEVSTAADISAAKGQTEELSLDEQTLVSEKIAQLIPSVATAQEEINEIESKASNAAPKKETTKQKTDAKKKREILLPSLTGALTAVSTEGPQSAPLGDRAEGKKVNFSTNRKASLENIPSITGVIGKVSEESVAVSTSKTSKAALNLPSVEEPTSNQWGSETTASKANLGASSSTVSAAGSFAVSGATGTFDPVSDDFIADIPEEEIYVEDVDDSAYDAQATETGAMTGPGYVDMPQSRFSRFIGHFRKHDNNEVRSFSDSIGVDEDFEARKVGAARGSWESFRDDEAPNVYSGAGSANGDTELFEPLQNLTGYSDYDSDDYYEEDEWNGGGFSLNSLRHHESKEEEPVQTRHRREVKNPFEGLPLNFDEVSSERDDMHAFKAGTFDKEIWFVALGSELAGSAGMKAFIEQNAADLRGALIIDIEALGAGELTQVTEEGVLKKVKLSSRMKRFIRSANTALDVKLAQSKWNWGESAAGVAAKKGYQAIHLAGMQAGKPANFAEGQDTLEGISLVTLSDNATYVFEVMRNI